MRSVEIFAGAGGLAIGMANAGFHHAAVIEWDPDACETFRENQRLHRHHIDQWPLHQVDVRGFDYGTLGDVVVVSGGPPVSTLFCRWQASWSSRSARHVPRSSARRARVAA